MEKSKAEKLSEELNHVPALPAAITRLIGIMDDPDTSVNDIVKAMEPATCAKVLSVANSAHYSRLRKVDTLEHAIAILGRNTIRDMVLGIAIVSMFSMEHGEGGFDYKKFWHKTIVSTQLALMFGKILKNPEISKIYTIGLIHDIGEVIFFLYFKAEYRKMLNLNDGDNLSQVEAETKVFGLSHAEIGKLLAEKWNLPESVGRIICYHEDPQKLKDNSDELRVGMIIHAADSLANMLFNSADWEEIFENEDELDKLFSNLSSQSNSLMNKIISDTSKTPLPGNWMSIIDEELAIVSKAVMPIMRFLLSSN